MMDVERICAEYLRSVSPMAQRIAEDIDSVRVAYKDLWDALDAKDKNQVVDEALIDPAAVVKYANENKENNFELEPLSNFSWFTQSQLNLFTHIPHCNQNGRSKRTPIKCSDITPNQKKRLTSPLSQHEALIRSPQEKSTSKGRQLAKTIVFIQDKSDSQHEHPVNFPKATTIIAKPKNPPPPPPHNSKSETRALLEQEDNIPKTGFDFLDNW